MDKLSKYAMPLVNVLIGVLLLILKVRVVSIVLTVLAVVYVVLGILDLTKKQTVRGIVRIIVGVAIGLCGWFLISLALYAIAVIMIICAIAGIVNLRQSKTSFGVDYFQPIALAVIGICLFLHQGAAVEWVFIVAGICFIINGIIGLMNTVRK